MCTLKLLQLVSLVGGTVLGKVKVALEKSLIPTVLLTANQYSVYVVLCAFVNAVVEAKTIARTANMILMCFITLFFYLINAPTLLQVFSYPCFYLSICNLTSKCDTNIKDHYGKLYIYCNAFDALKAGRFCFFCSIMPTIESKRKKILNIKC